MSEDKKAIIAGVDVTGLPLEVQAAIRKAAEKAAVRVVEKAKAKAKAEADELAKWQGLANTVSSALTKEQKAAIGEGSLRIWFEDGKVKTWRVFKSRNGGNGSNAVWYKENGKQIEFASGQALCQYLGLSTNGNSATRVLEKNNVPFTRTKPEGIIVKAKA